MARYMSHPTWVRGLKRNNRMCTDKTLRSHPTWVRGLKLLEWIVTVTYIMSHPTWVRGLKPFCFNVLVISLSRTLRGCVD